jgi:multidrug transporter EmrE-like cation transporter
MKINYIALLVGIMLGFLAQITTFFQLQGSLKYDWFKNNYWIVVFMGIPISMLFMESVKQMVTAYGGQLWPSRLIGFSIGAIVFTWLSWWLFKEPLTMKTMVSLLFAVGILCVQIFWK